MMTLITVLAAYGVQGQDCTLGLGGSDSGVIVQVFQLNEEQQSKMQGWEGELQRYHEGMADKIRQLFDTHPQNTTEELQQLASKYRVLKDEIVATAVAYDRKLLAIFNQRQYQRYQELCQEAGRQPMDVPLSMPPIAAPD